MLQEVARRTAVGWKPMPSAKPTNLIGPNPYTSPLIKGGQGDLQGRHGMPKEVS